MLLSFAFAAALMAQPQPSPPPRPSRARPAQMRAGSVSVADYPLAAIRAEAQGVVTTRYLIDRSGAVAACQIARSSGNADLDSVSCRIVTERFRFEPALDARGRRTQEWRTQRFVWRMPEPEPEPVPKG